MTRIKLIIAQVLYRMLRLMGISNKKRIRRGGIHYEVDLTEGIDLFLFLFGVFQRHVVSNKYFSLPDEAIIFDIGANIGSMALNFARLIPEGYIYAFEPTHFAFEKLKQNISLNSGLAERVRAVQLFVSDRSGPSHGIRAYSSWKVDGSAQNTHPLHGGMIRNAEGISAVTIDDFCKQNHISRVDLIKIDTDGYELQVLKGAHQTIEKCSPFLIFEIGLYVLNEHQLGFEQYCNYFKHFDYILINSKTGKVITLDNYWRQIPLRSTTDIVAVPSNKMKRT
ncbi:MAG: FkbM family methyltransferase [Deltaproteobacteria bacterium]|nr:MAG: FkbM family methyltransferase [Deltaproteobacteria bacterium]